MSPPPGADLAEKLIAFVMSPLFCDVTVLGIGVLSGVSSWRISLGALR